MEIGFYPEMAGFMSEIFQNILLTEAVPPRYLLKSSGFFQDSVKIFTSTQSCGNKSQFDHLVTGISAFSGSKLS